MPLLPPSLAMLRDDLLRGGITVDTPAGAPRLRSVVQFDGDIQTLVAAADFDAMAANPEPLRGLMAAHQAQVSARLKIYAQLQRAGTCVHYVAWGASGSLMISDAAIAGIRHFIWFVAPAALPLLLRYLLPMALPGLVKLALETRTSVIADTNQELTKLRAKRPAAG